MYIPNGVMGAIDIFPYACNEGLREHYFIAYGITLVTENRFGKLVYFHGDADIRVTEPDPGITIEVPPRGRTNKVSPVWTRTMGEDAGAPKDSVGEETTEDSVNLPSPRDRSTRANARNRKPKAPR